MLELVALQRLLQGEQVLCPPVAIQRLGDGRRVLLAPMIPSLGQLLRVAFPRKDRLDDRQARHAGNVADDVLQLDIHLGEGLLHVLDVPRGIGQQRGPLPSIAPQHDDLILRAETGGQQAVGVQALQPLAIMHVALRPAVAGHRARIDQQHLEATRFEHSNSGIQ